MSGLLDNLTQGAIRAAARRWPEDERDDAVAEWTAELHMIGDHPWRAFRYAASLALSRSDRELGMAPIKAGQHVRSAAVLVLAPLAGTALCGGLVFAIAYTSWFLPPVTSRELALAGMLLAASCGVAGWWFGGRSAVTGSPHAATWTVMLLAFGVFAITGGMLLTGFTGGIGAGALEVATLAWTATLWLTGWGLLALRRAGQRVLAAAVAVVGGIAAWVVPVTVAGLLETSAADAPRAYALMWPVVLLIGSFDEASTSVGGIYWRIVDALPLLPFLLIPATVFGLAYLAGAGRRTGQAAAPALDTA